MEEILQFLITAVNNYTEQDLSWFKTLVDDSLAGRQNAESDSDMYYNTTIIDNITANLTATDVKTIVKIRLIFKTIQELWIHYNGNINLLGEYILTEKPTAILPNPPTQNST